MKKLICVMLAALLLLCACAQGSGDDNAVTSGKKGKFAPSGQEAKSSIFGRNVKYDAFTPDDALTLPIPSEEILDMVQIEKALYFLTDGAVYTLNIESGASGKLFDTDAKMFYAHGGRLYTYAPETSKLSEYDTSGSVTKETEIEVTDVESVIGLAVTDDYYIFKCYIAGKMYMETYLFIYSRDTEELALSKKMPLEGIDLYPYKGNRLLSVSRADTAYYLGIFDAESGKNTRVHWLDTEYRPAAAYCPKTDTALVYGVPARMIHNSGYVQMLDDVSPCCIYEYSLDDEDVIVHNRYYFDSSHFTKFFISIYENIVSAVATSDSEYRVFDYLNPPESITVLGGIYNQNAIYSFEKETGILLRTADADYDKMILKLMAGDDDFDVFYAGGLFHHFVDSGAYVDLKDIESLNSRISSNVAADFIVGYDGKYFGVPIYVRNPFKEENYAYSPESLAYFPIIALENTYLAKNIDITEGRYSDPDGQELYKLFKYVNDNPKGGKKKHLFGDDATILGAGVYLLNPQSQNCDNAIRFLEHLFDCYNGDIPGAVPEDQLYPKLESTENYYAEWRCRSLDIVGAIFDTRLYIENQNGSLSNSDLKKLAKETAAEVRMRMME